MVNYELSNDISLSLLVIIVNRGRGSKILEFAVENGATDASCLLGKGTIKNSMLQLMEINEVDKEIVFMAVQTQKVDEILNHLNYKYHIERPNHGIAFTMSLAGVLKMKTDRTVKWNNDLLKEKDHFDYTAIFLVVNKGVASEAIQISQDNGYYGGTIIKARGSANKLNIVLDMIVEPEKEAVLMLLESKRADELSDILSDKLNLNQENTGILIKVGVNQTIGLFSNKNSGGQKDE